MATIFDSNGDTIEIFDIQGAALGLSTATNPQLAPHVLPFLNKALKTNDKVVTRAINEVLATAQGAQNSVSSFQVAYNDVVGDFLGNPFLTDNMRDNIGDTILDSLYELHLRTKDLQAGGLDAANILYQDNNYPYTNVYPYEANTVENALNELFNRVDALSPWNKLGDLNVTNAHFSGDVIIDGNLIVGGSGLVASAIEYTDNNYPYNIDNVQSALDEAFDRIDAISPFDKEGSLVVESIEAQKIKGYLFEGEYIKEYEYQLVNGLKEIKKERYYKDLSPYYYGTGGYFIEREYYYDDEFGTAQQERLGYPTYDTEPWLSTSQVPYKIYKTTEKHFSEGVLQRTITENYGLDVDGDIQILVREIT